jgi:hypothetical protein
MEKDKSDELSRAVKISNMPVDFPEEELINFLDRYGMNNVENYFMDNNWVLVVFREDHQS